MRKILAMVGEPGVGKSTLMKRFMKDKEWEQQQLVKLVPTSYNKELDLHVFGRYLEEDKYPGVDQYSMAVQPAAVEFTKAVKTNILFEGDKLSTQSFLEHLITLPDTEVLILFLTVPKDILDSRRIDRGDDREEKFYKAKGTKYNNILNSFMFEDNLEVYSSVNSCDQDRIYNRINNFFGIDNDLL